VYYRESTVLHQLSTQPQIHTEGSIVDIPLNEYRDQTRSAKPSARPQNSTHIFTPHECPELPNLRCRLQLTRSPGRGDTLPVNQ